MTWNLVNNQKYKIAEVDKGSKKEYKLFTTAKQTNLYKCSSFLYKFAGLLLCSFLCYFFAKYYCRWVSIKIHDGLQYIYQSTTNRVKLFWWRFKI